MFDVGFWELFLTGLIALIVFGPERLPGLARTVGLWVGRARAAFYSVREEMEREINADGLRETQRALRRELEEGTRSIAKTARIGDTAVERQASPSQPPTEKTADAAGHIVRERAGEVHSPCADEPLSPSPKNSSEADRTGSNAR